MCVSHYRRLHTTLFYCTGLRQLCRYHDDKRVSGDHLVVELLRHHQDSTLGVQMEELGAVRVEAAVDGVHQFTVGVGVLRADLQDVFPRRGVLGNPHLKHTGTDEMMGEVFQGNEKGKRTGNKWVCESGQETEILDFYFSI